MNLFTPLPSFDSILLEHKTYTNTELLLLWIVIAFSICCRQIYQYNKNYESWKELSTALYQLHDAEKILFDQRTKHNNIFGELRLNTIRSKSVIPFLCTYLISKIASPNILEKQEYEIKYICETIGNIFWISDDLADFLKDMQTGTPNYVSICADYFILTGQNYCCDNAFHLSLQYVIGHLFILLQKLDRITTSYSTNGLREFVRNVYYIMVKVGRIINPKQRKDYLNTTKIITIDVYIG